jgi:hypothetical protein
MPLLDYYGKKGILVNFIGETSDEITPSILELLNKYF